MRSGSFVALAFALLAAPGLAQPRLLPLELPALVSLPRLTFSRGSDGSALDAALAFCREHAEGTAQAACMPERFVVEAPLRAIRVSAFRLDRTEVTRIAYARCVASGRCLAPRDLPREPGFEGDTRPVVGIRWDDARRYCASVGGRLPSEAEWERAARGASSRYYPWGDAWDPRLANHGRAFERIDASDGYPMLAPVGSFPAGATPEGLVDLAGNVAEWVEDPFLVDEYEHGAGVDPRPRGGGGLRIVRGGSFLGMPHELRAAARRIEAEESTFPDVGFRCAYDRPPSAAPPAP